ncbi:TSUP family transporter [Propionibacteriaceae bacterium Y1685]
MLEQISALGLWTLTFLVLAALVAGWIDAVVGGGGLIQLPALLIALPDDTPPPSILGTNKLSSVAGTITATLTYLTKVKVHWGTVLPLVITAYLGSSLGAWLAQFVPKELFTPIVLIALVGVGIYTWRKPSLGMVSAVKHSGFAHLWRTGTIGLGIGCYDGILGPGTGSFFVILLVALLGYGFLEATAKAKLANLTTNVAALVVFGVSGHLLIGLGLLMALANLTGGFIGARMAVSLGNSFVRKVFLVVVGALIIKLTWDLVAPLLLG